MQTFCHWFVFFIRLFFYCYLKVFSKALHAWAQTFPGQGFNAFNVFSYLKCTVAITCNWKYCYEIFKPYMQRNILFMQRYIVFRKYIWRIHCVTVNRPRIWTVDKFEILYITQTVHVRLHVMLLAASVQMTVAQFHNHNSLEILHEHICFESSQMYQLLK